MFYLGQGFPNWGTFTVLALPIRISNAFVLRSTTDVIELLDQLQFLHPVIDYLKHAID